MKLSAYHPDCGIIEIEIPEYIAGFLSDGQEKGLSMGKPDLSLYTGRKVVSVIRENEKGEWGIELEDRVLILNKHPKETVPPGDEIVGCKFVFISMSLHDTTLHFMAANGHKHVVSFPPTYYVIADAVHGGEVYPQWPEELEEQGVPATPEGGISDKPSEEWAEEEAKLKESKSVRVQSDAAEFLAEGEA